MIKKSEQVGLIVLVVAILILPLSVLGQDFKRQYRNAKDFFNDKKYNLAMEAFKPLIVYDRDNPYPEYASFYYALSAYHQGYTAVAKDMLIQIKKLYQEWDQLHEVNYWLAKIYFDQREYFQAMLMLKQINNPSMSAAIEDMKKNYFRTIDDIETLYMALEEYPVEREIARALAAKLSLEAYKPEVLMQFDSLVTGFQLNRNEFNLNHGPVSVKKDKYVVALLFPFLAATLEPTPATKVNQQILDLYQGMRMSRDSLAKKGIQLEFRLYDTERSQDKLALIVESEELKDADLIVGPIFTDARLVKEFSARNEIPMISPINNLDYTVGNPNSFLFPPGYETIGKRSAELVAQRIRNKNCIVFYGDTPKDSVQAFAFIARAKELGVKIILAEEHRRETANAIISRLATPTEFDEWKTATQFTLKKDSLGSIFVASDDPLIYSKVNTSVTTRGDSVVVIGNESWIAPENTSASYENFERNHVLMAAPRFYSEHHPAFGNFRDSYMSAHGTYPSPQVIAGYEFTLAIGQMLSRHGTYFIAGLRQDGFFPGYLYQGFDYSTGQDNQYVPFVYFKNGQLTVFNSPK